jgi:hypothetical protein
MKELNTVKILIIIIIILISIGWVKKENSSLEIKKIGALSIDFDYIDDMWRNYADYEENKKERKMKNYIILENSSIIGGYSYILIDFNKLEMESKSWQTKIISKKQLKKEDLINLKEKISKLTDKNNIYDGTLFVKDGGIEIVRFYKNGLKNKFGLRGGFNSKEKNLYEERLLNSEIIDMIHDLARD